MHGKFSPPLRMLPHAAAARPPAPVASQVVLRWQVVAAVMARSGGAEERG